MLVTRIHIITIGKDKDSWVTEGLAHYEKLLSRWAKIEWGILSSPKQISSDTPLAVKQAEAARFADAIDDSKFIALTIEGKTYDSHAFSKQLSKWQELFGGKITFVIGGAYGLDESLIKRASAQLSLSPLTYSHQLTRLVLLEQLFRGFSISHNTDYHK
jgi:23S rRNA (pseudouridine1915-N3)-methyltransferase